MSEENLSCSFCGLSKLQTKVLVAGQDAHICDQCIEQAFSILSHQKTSEDLTTSSDITDLSPKKRQSIHLLLFTTIFEMSLSLLWKKNILSSFKIVLVEVFSRSLFESCHNLWKQFEGRDQKDLQQWWARLSINGE